MRPGARWLGLGLAALAGVVVAAVLVGPRLGGTSGSPSALPSASATPDGSPTPLPSQSSWPAPSEDPAVARLVLRLEGGGLFGRFHVFTLLEDGRIITTTNRDPMTSQGDQPMERRLTAAGVQLLLDELDATGLTFLTSAAHMPVAKPGFDLGLDGAAPALEVGLPGGGTAVTTWVFIANGDLYGWEPQPVAEVLDALYVRLSTFDEWLPADAWADANARPYVPARYRIFLHSDQWGGSFPVESATVSWPLDQGIDAYGDAVENVGQEPGGPDASRCRVVSAEEATAVIEALEAAGATPSDQTWISFQLGYRATSGLVSITIEPILPQADTSCGLEITF